MVWLRKSTILTHRWLGIVLSLLFVGWFASGIAMIYAGGMPALSREERLDRRPALALTQVALTATDAAQIAELGGAPSGVILLNVMDRPAYRFLGREPVTVFADTGEILEGVGESEAISIASRFINLPKEKLHYSGLLTEPDQWTITERSPSPYGPVTHILSRGAKIAYQYWVEFEYTRDQHWLRQRRRRLQERLQAGGVDAVVVGE